jgi:6,7-dimethyl-8-ribityllumazine synthase
MTLYRGRTDGSGRRFVVVVSRFNETVTDRLLAGARACLLENGVSEGDIDVVSVPGAWELPIAAQLAARRGGYAACRDNCERCSTRGRCNQSL